SVGLNINHGNATTRQTWINCANAKCPHAPGRRTTLIHLCVLCRQIVKYLCGDLHMGIDVLYIVERFDRLPWLDKRSSCFSIEFYLHSSEEFDVARFDCN